MTKWICHSTAPTGVVSRLEVEANDRPQAIRFAIAMSPRGSSVSVRAIEPQADSILDMLAETTDPFPLVRPRASFGDFA